MHAEHAERQRMRARETSQPHKRHRDRDLGEFRQLPNFIGRVSEHRPATDVDHRLFRLHDLFSGLLNLVFVSVNRRIVTAQVDFVRVFKFGLRDAHVLRNID